VIEHELQLRLDDLERRINALETGAAAPPPRAGAATGKRSYVQRNDRSIQRVLAGASSRIRPYGHAWIRQRVDPLMMLAYQLSLAGALADQNGMPLADVARQVNRVFFVMQNAVAAFYGKKAEDMFA
jgi:hypothetical protein